jgi:ubiquinone/menaquinone biosynthesis C-methylase UbiE
LPGAAYEAIWGRTFATLYDCAFMLAERRGFREVRRRLVGRANGRVLEIGAGTGLNLEHYSSRVSELVLTEPDLHMVAKLRTRVATIPKELTVMQASAEEIPVDDATIDSVVSTLVLCTVPEPDRALREIVRILRPGGSFLFAEHVRSDSPWAARWQDRLNRPWGWYACGCECNRDTIASIEKSRLRIDEMSSDRLRWISPLVRPLVIGIAVNDGLS